MPKRRYQKWTLQIILEFIINVNSLKFWIHLQKLWSGQGDYRRFDFIQDVVTWPTPVEKKTKKTGVR